MKKYITIYHESIEIPAIIWGKPETKLIIAVHGDMSHKEDIVIELLAKAAILKGYSLLSFDLPEHGDRKGNDYPLTPPNCIADLCSVYSFAQTMSQEISLFACSLGAYFSLLAFHGHKIRKMFFLSPVVNMEKIIRNMMSVFLVTEERLKSERQILLPIGKTLDWEYYVFTRKHTVCLSAQTPITILYGSEDNISERFEIEKFVTQCKAELNVMVDGEHFFHTVEQLNYFRHWLSENL